MEIKTIKITKDMNIDEFANAFFEKNYDYFKETCAYNFVCDLDDDFESFYGVNSFRELCDNIQEKCININIPENINNITKLKKWLWNNRQSLKKDFVEEYYFGINTFGSETDLTDAMDDYLNDIRKKSSNTLDDYLNSLVYKLNKYTPDIQWSYKNYRSEFELKGKLGKDQTKIYIYLYDQFEDMPFSSDEIVFDVFNLKIDKNRILSAVNYIVKNLTGKYINLNKSIL